MTVSENIVPPYSTVLRVEYRSGYLTHSDFPPRPLCGIPNLSSRTLAQGIMVEERPHNSSTEQVHDIHANHISHDPEDVDFIRRHLNDPNFDLFRVPSLISIAENNSAKESVGDVESHFESGHRSTSRVESGDLKEIDFHESVVFCSPLPSLFLTKCDSESPYLEVRAAVSSVDDPLMPVNTFRVWFLGIFFVLLTSGLNQVLVLRCMSLCHLAQNAS
jgi:hypothetical protein